MISAELVRTHEGRGRGSRKSVCLHTRGEGGSLRSRTYTCKKNICTFSSLLRGHSHSTYALKCRKRLERPQISDITQKHDKNNTFHTEFFYHKTNLIHFRETKLL